MKDKEKQIEEMAKTGCSWSINCKKCSQLNFCLFMWHAKRIYNAGYRKITDSVVLTREEYHKSRETIRALEENYYKKVVIPQECKETAKKCIEIIKRYVPPKSGLEHEIAREFGIEITTDDNCKYYDKANMRCNGAKCTPECYCNGHKSECTEYPETRKQFGVEIRSDYEKEENP